MRLLLEAKGLKAAVLSLDDLYLSRAERNRLAATIHPLLCTRGPPGTHDVELGQTLLHDLMRAREVKLPSFDKASDNQHGPEQLKSFNGPADVVIFEGWCVGARPEAPGPPLPFASLRRAIRFKRTRPDPRSRGPHILGPRNRRTGELDGESGRLDVPNYGNGEFTTSSDCKLVVVHLRRLPAGSPIRGKLWVDDFRLTRKPS